MVGAFLRFSVAASIFLVLGTLLFSWFSAPKKPSVEDTLTDDGRVGKVVDVQGVVGLKPVMNQRWTPLREHTLIKPGDWIRTDVRGANAVELSLVKNTNVILGPGSLLEVMTPTRLRLHAGELEIDVPAAAAVELLGPEKTKLDVKGTRHFRLDGDSLVRVEKEPPWLKGFKGATHEDPLGSLVAQVDGRNVPLSVGYHKVTVDIRDQIARTTIEESFVNHTDTLLEGVFHFPLPSDASISGFGMWVGNDLIEADVVEKQRAREIYETILSEKRDPGLLEWTGGNIFKARVYPIFAHSEKRIKITYTQVLPLTGNQFRYTYALKSEMLQQHPLRELAIDVKIHTTVPLRSVKSPTHTMRFDQTAHSAHLEFSAQEHTPSADFEAVFEVAQSQEIVLIPHRRGDDGYFMVQLMPKSNAVGNRDLLPNGPPLRLLILTDTSASMDEAQRQLQATFLASLLTSLTPGDTFNLATVDVECDWAFDKPLPASAHNASAARKFLDERTSLGWTDLDRAFASVLKQCGPDTHIIYIGDGIISTRDADPEAFVKRLRGLFEGQPGTCHAVALGSSHEATVLKAMAAHGGGSVRRIDQQHGPRAMALDLLKEIVQPGLRNLKVEFKGLRVAKVYPEELPNLPGGSQQILLGRYLPQGKDQTGEITVTGTQNGKPVRFVSALNLKDAEEGNSFIPRLWARMHLDHLLAKGMTEPIRDEIIALSEEYQIITPYTSLLVLESDEDRERFRVKRRFQMRDGEKFFAEGRDNANFELMQQQMKRAGNWRLELRKAALQSFAALGRDGRMFQTPTERLSWEPASGGASYAYNRSQLYLGRQHGRFDFGVVDFDGSIGAEDVSETGMAFQRPSVFSPSRDFRAVPSAIGGAEGAPGQRETESLGKTVGVQGMIGDALDDPNTVPPETPALEGRPFASTAGWGLPNLVVFPGEGNFGGELQGNLKSAGVAGVYFENQSSGDPRRASPYSKWIDQVFPSLGAPPKARIPFRSTWPEEAKALSRSLLRIESLAQLAGAIRIVWESRPTDLSQDEPSPYRWETVYSPQTWQVIRSGRDADTLIEWCNGQDRGVYSKAFGLGRVRRAQRDDLRNLPFSLTDYSITALDEAFNDFSPTVQKPDAANQVRLVLQAKSDKRRRIHIDIDTRRHVITSLEHSYRGKVTGATKYEDFVEVADRWWATSIRNLDDREECLAKGVVRVESLTDQAMQTHMDQLKQKLESVQAIRQPLPTPAASKTAIAGNSATFDHHFALLVHYAASQQWSKVREHLRDAERLAPSGFGVRWLRYAVMHVARQHEELKQHFMDEATTLAKGSADEDRFLASHLINVAGNTLSANERHALLKTIRPLYERSPYRSALRTWKQLWVEHLGGTEKEREALQLAKELATENPKDVAMQRRYAEELYGSGDPEAAYRWLSNAFSAESELSPAGRDELRMTYAQWLNNEYRLRDLLRFVSDWMKQNPESASAYFYYLSALVRSGEDNKATELVTAFLGDACALMELSPVALARVQGVMQTYESELLDDACWDAIAKAILHFCQTEDEHGVADRFMQRVPSQQSEKGTELRKRMAAMLTSQIDKLPPERIQRYVRWLWTPEPVIDRTEWMNLKKSIRARWEAEKDPGTKHQFAQLLILLLSHLNESKEHIAFLDELCQNAPFDLRLPCTRQLFETLLLQPWTAEYEAMAFGLLDSLSDADDMSARTQASVEALHRLTDRMLAGRYDALMQKIDHPEKLTRTELREKEAENRRLSRTEFADRLRREAEKRSDEFLPLELWLSAERMYLDTLLGRDLDKVAADCWRGLGDKPAKNSVTPDEASQLLSRGLENRYLQTLAHLVTRKNTDQSFVDRFLNYLEAGIEANPAESRWKMLKYQTLIALDRPKELEKCLQQWIKADDPVGQWQIALGYVLAEQGKIADAVKQLETVAANGELGTTAYRALADWYLVINRREDHERALFSTYMTMDEDQLGLLLEPQFARHQRGDANSPRELDKEVLPMLTVLFEKSSVPSMYFSPVRQFYANTRDFRLLANLPDAVVGHSAGRIYPYFEGMRLIFQEIRDEATTDELLGRLNKVRERVTSDVDRRALDLLEVMVERRAAELKNQGGVHSAKALAALQRAFRRQWAAGEPQLMSTFLAELGVISEPRLAEEQLRQIEELKNQAPKGSLERLEMTHHYATVLGQYDRSKEAIPLLQSALKEFDESNDDALPHPAQAALDSLLVFLETAGRFKEGEQLLSQYLERSALRRQHVWLTHRKYQLYQRALETRGETSLGSGRTLYRALHQRLQNELETTNPNQWFAMLERLMSVYRMVDPKDFPEVVDDVRTFAFKRFPELFEQQVYHHENIAGQLAQLVKDRLGPRDGIAFLLDRIDGEPKWWRRQNQNGWNRYGSLLGQWRAEAKTLGDVDERLLKLAVAELRRHLENQQHQNPYLFRQPNHFWAEKEADFAAVAERVLADQRDSAKAVNHIAAYFYQGLGRTQRAIEILLDAHERKVVDESGLSQLADYLRHASRHAEAIEPLETLVVGRPDWLDYRVRLMRSYFLTGRHDDLQTLLKKTDALFHEKKQWNEHVIAALGNICVETKLFSQAVTYLQEAIALHKGPHRPGRDEASLVSCYSQLGRAHAGLGQTAEAVDAACAAVVIWGPPTRERGHALETLRHILREAPDLDAYVAQLDAKSAETGLQNPIVRKAAGHAYLEKEKYTQAVVQLELASALQPHDMETHQLLLRSYDALQDQMGAVRQLLRWVQFSRRDIKLYADLGTRLQGLDQKNEAERAYTSMVEVMPNEAEGHALLAEIRQKQDRWPEAVVHWERVVKIRELEPTGLLKLAAAQIHMKDWKRAKDSIARLRAKSWPVRFADVEGQIKALELQLDDGK